MVLSPARLPGQSVQRPRSPPLPSPCDLVDAPSYAPVKAVVLSKEEPALVVPDEPPSNPSPSRPRFKPSNAQIREVTPLAMRTRSPSPIRRPVGSVSTLPRSTNDMLSRSVALVSS